MNDLLIRHIARAAISSSLILLLASCSDGPPVLRSQVAASFAPPTDSDDPVAAQCQALRDQIRANRESEREAPSFSTSPQIVAAGEAKADQRIDDLRSRMDTLDCADAAADKDSSQDSTGNGRMAPLPPAPNAPNP